MGTEKRKMSVTQLTIITAINMMGSGIIMLPRNLAEVGTMSILSWVVTVIGALLLAYTFSQCGMMSKKGGGMGGYAEYAFGKSGSFLANYTYGVSLIIANGAIAVSAVQYAVQLFGLKLPPIGIYICTIATLWLATVLNFGGAKITGKISSVTVWGVIIPVIVITILGWFWFDGTLFVNSWNPHKLGFFEGVSKSISITLWAFLGLESASANMDTVENPKKNIPIACLGGTIGVAVIYIMSTGIMQGIVPNDILANSNAPFGTAFATMFNPIIGKIVVALMIVSCFGSLLGWQFTIAQVFKTSAVEGYFPKVFGVETEAGVPLKGMLIITTIQSCLLFLTISPNLSKQFNILVDLAVVTNIIPYLLSMGAVNVMQKRENVSGNKNRITNITAVLAALYSLYALYSVSTQAFIYGSLVTFLGWILYGRVAYKY